MAAQLIVRNLEDEVVEALQRRAKRHGRSAEAEHRLILRNALRKKKSLRPSLKELLLSIPKAPCEDLEDLFERAADLPREVEL